MDRLSLSKALLTGRLDEFIDQEEARGVGPVSNDGLNSAIAATIKAPRSEDQTLRSLSDDDLNGT